MKLKRTRGKEEYCQLRMGYNIQIDYKK